MVLTGGEEHDPPSGTRFELGSERLDKQQRGAGVHGVGQVNLSRGELLERLPRAAGVVGDHHVQPAEGLSSHSHELSRGGWVGEVCADVGEAATLGAQLIDQLLRSTGIRTRFVSRCPGMHQDGGTVCGQSADEGSADCGAATRARHQRDTAGQRCR